jgi:hypothetical protein
MSGEPSYYFVGAAAYSRSRSSIRRILPVNVLGSSSTNSMRRGYAYWDSRTRTKSAISCASSSLASLPAPRMMNALTTAPRRSSGEATAAASRTAGCSMQADSTSNGRVRVGAEADLSPLAARYLLFVLVEDADVPAGHGSSHRALAHVHPGVVRDQRVRLGQAVVVEDGDVVFLAEPTDGLGVEWLPGRADAAE